VQKKRGADVDFQAVWAHVSNQEHQVSPHLIGGESLSIANLQKMAVAERREAEPTTQHRNEVGLAVRQATIELLAEKCRQ